MDINRYIAEEIYGELEPEITDLMKSGFNEGLGNATCRTGQLSDGRNWRLKEGWEQREKKGWIYSGRERQWRFLDKPYHYKHPVPEWEPIRFDEDFDLAMDAVIKAASPEHEEYSVIVEKTTHAYYAYYSDREIYLYEGDDFYMKDQFTDNHVFPCWYSTSANGPSQALANLAIEIHKKRNS